MFLYESNGVIIIKNGRILFEILRKTCDQKGRSQPYIISINFIVLRISAGIIILI